MTESFRARLVSEWPEEWRPIPGLHGYEASSCGRIRSIPRVVVDTLGRPQRKPGRVLALVRMKRGYLKFGTNRRGHLVSRAVLMAFVGPPQSGFHEACHCNGDRADNRPENLRWDTSKGNNADKLRHGTLLWGERHGAAKLTRAQVDAIRSDRRPAKEIAADYGISRSHAGSVRRGDFWKGLAA